MAGYGYTYRGSYTTYNGVPPRTDGWSKTSYSSDQVSQPVFIDADGRRKPIMSYTPNGNTEYYVTKTEIIEVPFVSGYKQSTPVKVEVLRDYGDVEGNWNRPSSPEKWHRSSSPVRYHAGEKWNRPSSPVHEQQQQQQEVGDFITKVQTGASRPNKFGPVGTTYWRQTPNPNSYHVNNTGYGDQSDLSNKEWQKPSENYDGPSYRRDNYLEPPTMTTGGAWAKPSHGAWSNQQGANLSQPTSDINTAMGYLKEAAKPSSGITSPPSRYTIPASTGRKRDIYPETIDSKEAERRYGISTGRKRDIYPETIDSKEAERRYGIGNLKLASSDSRPMGNYTTRTIDSREAARKYGGTTV